MQYDAVFFDIGNTLFFFNYDFFQRLLRERFDLTIPVERLASAHDMTKRSLVRDGTVGKLDHHELWIEAYRRWMRFVGIAEEYFLRIAEVVRTHPEPHLFWSRRDEGTIEMLDWLRGRNYRLGVISNAEGQIKQLIEHAGITDRFDVIIDSGEVGFDKPDERIFRHAMEQMGVQAERSVYVGDLYRIDVVGARKVGMTPVLVDPDGTHAQVDCLCVKRVTELPTLPIFAEE